MLSFYRHNIRCSDCRMTTRSKDEVIKHHAHCTTNEQNSEMLLELKFRMLKMVSKRVATVATKALEGIEVVANYAKVQGSTGTYSVRKDYCSCPAFKFGKGKTCKHIARVIKAVQVAAPAFPRIINPVLWGLPPLHPSKVVIPAQPWRLVS
jgi:predicted nucleic acid-binding Zn finger protein